MRTMFQMGFRQPFEARSLGQGGGVLPLLTEGLQAWKAYEQSDIATEQRKAQEAQAKAAAAQQAAAAANVQAAQITNPTILGLPRDTAIMGGIGILLLVGLAAFLKSK